MRAFIGGAICLLTISPFFATTTTAGAEPRVKEGWTVPLDNLGINGTVARLDEPHNWKVRQVSSFDRSGGNNDDRFGHQVWDGGVILADLEGPGVVTRIWTRNPHGTLHIFIDDIEHPVISIPFKDLFSTKNIEHGSLGFDLIGAPLTGQGSGGFFSYIPMPYESRCRIMATDVDDSLGYQVTYIDLPAGSPIQSFNIDLTKDDRSFFKRWEKSWKSTNYRHSKRKKEKVWHSRHNYIPGANYQVVPLEGSGVITEIEMVVESYDQVAMDGVWIAVFFDGQKVPGVLAPIGDFFAATSKDVDDYDSLPLGRVEGRMWCRYPMPYRESADIRIINTTGEVADIEYWVTYRPGKVDHQNYFFARYNSGVTEEGAPYEVVSIDGQGHFVGSSISATNADSLIILEGDDTYAIDGRSTREFHGTGTDDYFNAGWYFAEGATSGPTHGIALKGAKKPNGFSAFRSHFTEPVVFSDSFVFNLEHGPNNDRPGVDYTSVSYWYQNDKAPGLKEIPEIADVPLTRGRQGSTD